MKVHNLCREERFMRGPVKGYVRQCISIALEHLVRYLHDGRSENKNTLWVFRDLLLKMTFMRRNLNSDPIFHIVTLKVQAHFTKCCK